MISETPPGADPATEARTCPGCGSLREVTAPLPWPGFAHIDHRPFTAPPLVFLACPRCGLVGRRPSPSDPTPESVFTSHSYAARNRPLGYVRATEGSNPTSLPARQVEIIRREGIAAAAVLDIGCFDGRLLNCFREALPQARLVGYDVNPHYQTCLPDDVAYVCGDLGAVSGPFDLIVLSHSLQYEADIRGLFDHIDRLLAPDGVVYIQVPDYSLRPSSLLFSDLHHHFTGRSLDAVLQASGFISDRVQDPGFPRDAICLARRGTTMAGPTARSVAAELPAAVAALTRMAESVRELVDGRPWHVLGISIDSAFVIHLLGDDVIAVLDEAPGTQGSTFNGRLVRHPADLRGTDRAILPLGLHAEAVLRRFEATYDGCFALV